MVDCKGSGKVVATRRTKQELIEIKETYNAKIQSIKGKIEFKNCDSDIISAVSKLEASNFFSSTLPFILLAEGSLIAVPNFQELFNELEKTKNEFKALCNIEKQYSIRTASDEEIAICETLFCKNAWQVQTAEEFNDILHKENLKQRTRRAVTDEKVVDKLTDEIQATENNK